MAFGFLKKNYKKDPLKDAIFPVPPFLTGGIFLYGKVGAGKTTAMLSLAQKYHDHPERRMKIIDIWGGERNEQHYWALPSQDINYWGKIKKKFHLDEEGPKQYKVRFLYPMSRDLPNKLPQDVLNNIESKIFTIPINTITPDTISFTLGIIGNEGTYLWQEAMEKITRKDSAIKLKHYMKKLNGSNRSLYKNFVAPLAREGLLSSYYADTNLDLAAEVRDQETITIFCFDFLPKEYKLFVLGYIVDQLSKGYDNGSIRRHSICLVREASEFFRATDQAIVGDEFKIFRRFLSQSIRMGRKGLHLFLDTQSPAETKGIVDGQQDLTVLGKLPAEADRKFATDQMARDNLITSKQIQDIGMLEPGQYYICETSKKAAKRYFFLPRTMYWKPGYGSFHENVWKKLRDKWTDISDQKKYILDLLKKEEDEIEEHERLLKEQKEMKEKAAKEAQALKDQQDKELRIKQEIELKENLRLAKMKERLELKEKYGKKSKKRKNIEDEIEDETEEDDETEDDSEEFSEDPAGFEEDKEEIKEVKIKKPKEDKLVPEDEKIIKTSVDDMELF